MGYNTALSGLSAASTDLDVIGNNIANANTVGFKASSAQFADVYANSVASSVGTQVGIGVQVSETQQNFSQGTVTTTGSALDVAINGSGFFQLNNNGSLAYTRNGVFSLDKNGYITNAAGMQLQGYSATANGTIDMSTTGALKVPTTNIAPLATKSITAQLNLNAQDTVPTTAFDPTNPTQAGSYNYTTSIQTYDSLGGTNQVNMYFVKTGTGTWDVYAGQTGGNANLVGSVAFDSTGQISSTTVGGVATAVKGSIPLALTQTDGSITPQAVTLNLAGTTQYGGADGVNNLAQDGYATGSLTNFSIGSDGVLTGSYSNGQTQALGQIVLAKFNDENGLQNLGGNNWAATTASGVAQVAAPGSANHGTLMGSAVEASNVDLTTSLVDLIGAQRNYQANAQTIKTQQQVDQTLMNL